MSKEQLVLRLLSSVANIDSQRLRTGFLEELDFARIAPAMNALSEAPMYIDDTPNISAMELRTKARRLQAEAGLDLVIVDYLQLMQATTTNRDANRVQEVSEISRGLKALARELNVPVIALSQLSRQPEMRESKEPRLSDLRESGAIEQDADLVMFLWRDKERGSEDSETDGEVIKLKLAKHRNGPTGEVDLWFKKQPDPLRQLRRRTLRRGRLTSASRRRRSASRPSALVFEADLDLDAVFDDLAVLDDRARLHDLDGLDVADGLRGGRHGLTGGVAPRPRARPDHLPDDDDAHGSLLSGRRTAAASRPSCHEPTRFRAGLVEARAGRERLLGQTPAEVAVMVPARTLSKQVLQ